jgi:hypothetical protein
MDENDTPTPKTRKLVAIPEYGDHMPIRQWIEMCVSGSFIDYDGMANYATESQMDDSGEWVYPSQAVRGDIKDGWSHVVWFNR